MTTLRDTALLIALGVFALSCGGRAPAPPEDDAPPAPPAEASIGESIRLDPGMDALVPTDATIEKLAEGFTFIEGPVWDRQESRLLFSDVRGNELYQWSETDGASTFLDPVFEGDRAGKGSVSSNGLTFDATGHLIICEHGNRRISRLEDAGSEASSSRHMTGGS